MIKLLIFAITILFIGMDSESSSQIIINSRTDVFLDRTGEFFDSESMRQNFTISFDDSLFVRNFPDSNEEFRSKVVSMAQAKDKILGEVVTQFTVLNSHTSQKELYILWQRESGNFSLFQELPGDRGRILFDQNIRCVH